MMNKNYLFCYSCFGKYFGTLWVILSQKQSVLADTQNLSTGILKNQACWDCQFHNIPSFLITSITHWLKNPLQKTSEQSVFETFLS